MIADRNIESHPQNDSRRLLSLLMGLERYCHQDGSLESTVEGLALAFMVLLLGRRKFDTYIQEIRSNNVDFDPPCALQLERIRDVYTKR